MEKRVKISLPTSPPLQIEFLQSIFIYLVGNRKEGRRGEGVPYDFTESILGSRKITLVRHAVPSGNE